MMTKTIQPEQLAKSGSEHGHAAALMCWVAQNIKQYPELKWLTHIGHGGKLDKITAGRMKAEGLKRGVPDYLLLVRRGNYSALWIELKKLEGKLSHEQVLWLNQARECGHFATVCYGWEEARDVIIWYLNYGK